MTLVELLIASGPFIGQMADLATTERGIRMGYVETNPASWAQDTNRRRIVKAGMGIGMGLLLLELKRMGVSKKQRVIISIAGVVTGLIPAGINLSRTH